MINQSNYIQLIYNRVVDNEKTTNKPKILLIEDDLSLLEMYTKKFELEGFEVITARSGEEGLEAAKSNHPNIILLDLLLPRVKGLDVLILLSKDSSTENIPVLVLTNVADSSQSKKATEYGAREFLVKAMHTPEQIVQKVKNYITTGS